MPYLTPLATPVIDAGCSRISIPAHYAPIVLGALLVLTDERNWEQAGGVDTVQEAVTKMADMISNVTECSTMIGQILTVATAAPPPLTLECDGTEYLRVDYPELYAALDPAFVIDADTFEVPDLRGSAIIGEGLGDGKTSRAIGETGGDEEVVVTLSEMPEHSHDASANASSLPSTQRGPIGNLWGQEAAGTTATYRPGVSDGQMSIDAVTVSSTGSGDAHENMQPFIVLRFVIVASDG